MDENYKIEVFVFPDGTSVDVLVFDEDARRRGCTAPAATAHRGSSAPGPCCVPPPPAQEDESDCAHECPACGSTLVYPVDWDRSGRAAWTLRLRCPECETRREVVLGRAAVEQFNRELYRGAQAIAREADHLMRRNFEDEVERIVVALEHDLILPMDF
jgi:ribosomal protein S27E